MEVLGYPSDEDLEFIDNEFTLNYLRRLPKSKKLNWQEKFPDVSPTAIDLLEKLLRFSPDKRITVYEAIKHPYF